MRDYPYMFARVSAKRAKLMDSSDYESLLKMRPNEIARNLEEGEYRAEINELGARHEGIELVELALNRNLSKEFQHLCEIAPEKPENIIKTYLRKYDLTSIKRLLRWKKSGEENSVEDLMMHGGSFDPENFEELKEKDFEEIVKEIGFEDSAIDYQDYISPEMSLREIENALDRAYYRELEDLASGIRNKRFNQFIHEEMEYENLKTALRLKKYGFKREEIEEYLLPNGRPKLVEKVLNADNIEEAMDVVRTEMEVEGGRLEDLEHSLEIKRLEDARRMLHTEPLGLTSIFGYIIAKMTEIKNLRMLIRAKETGIQNLDTIRRNLVTA